MDKKRREWSAQYKDNPHVRRVPTSPDEEPMYLGFDDRLKTYEDLTPEEEKDWLEQIRQIGKKATIDDKKHQEER